jgi:hypothetical protein
MQELKMHKLKTLLIAQNKTKKVILMVGNFMNVQSL